jgi:hypothetical protein
MEDQAQLQGKVFEDRLKAGEQQMDQLAAHLAKAYSAMEEQLQEEAARRRNAEARALGLEERLASSGERSPSSQRTLGEERPWRHHTDRATSPVVQLADLEEELRAASSRAQAPSSKQAAEHTAELLIQDLERQLSNVELGEVALAKRQSDMQAFFEEHGELRQERDALEMRLASEAAKQDSYEASLAAAHAQSAALKRELDNSGRWMVGLERQLAVGLQRELAADASRWQEAKDQTANLRHRLSFSESDTRQESASRSEASKGSQAQARVSKVEQCHSQVRNHVVTRTQSMTTPRTAYGGRARVLDPEAILDAARPPRELSADDIFDRIDKNRDGAISRQDFLSAVQKGEFQVLPAPTAVLVCQDQASRILPPPARIRKSIVSTTSPRQTPRVTMPVTRSRSLPRFGLASGEVSPRSGSGSATPPRSGSPRCGGACLTSSTRAIPSPRIRQVKQKSPLRQRSAPAAEVTSLAIGLSSGPLYHSPLAAATAGGGMQHIPSSMRVVAQGINFGAPTPSTWDSTSTSTGNR